MAVVRFAHAFLPFGITPCITYAATSIAETAPRLFRVGLMLLCTPGTGVNLWGESPLYMNPVNVKDIDTSTSRKQGQNPGASQTGNVASCGHLSGNKPQRAVATIPDAGFANGHDQRLAQGSRASICQRAVGSHSLPGYGPVISMNRPVRTRMPGGVGAGGEKPPATRLGDNSFG